jgi:probable F420-dependent oxidoreductase
MRYMVNYPVLSDADSGAWLVPDNILTFARVLEDSGFDAVAFTDHPAPSAKWLDNGGHETLDAFAALSFCASVTKHLSLATYLTVVPYRNPFLLARSMMTLDVLSGGRAILTLGTGYLRSEFSALGVDFDERNALFDEATEVIKLAFSGTSVTFAGRHFASFGQVMRPMSIQRPHPPLWIGGNSSRALDRVAKSGQGWAALVGSANVAKTTRTPAIASQDDLADMILHLERRLTANGRTLHDIDIIAPTEAGLLASDTRPEQMLDELGQLASIGVTWANVTLPHGSFAQVLDMIRQFGAEVIAKLDS